MRRKLGLKTEKRHGSYVVAATEGPKLARLFEKYGIASNPVNSVNSVNSGGNAETPSGGEQPLII